MTLFHSYRKAGAIQLICSFIFATCMVHPSYAGQGGLSCNTGKQRLFRHELLLGKEICLPGKIRRVVALEIGAAELSLLTGKELIGAPGWLLNELNAYQPQWKDAYAETEDVGIPANLERLVRLKPDVILAVGKSEYTHKLIDIKKAQNIAPVIAADPAIYRNWKTNMQFWASAFGDKGLYDAMLMNYQARIGELRQKLRSKWHLSANNVIEVLGKKEVSMASVTSDGISMWLSRTAPAAILRDIGFGRPASQSISADEAIRRYKDDAYARVGREYLPLLDGDLFFGFAYGTNKPELIKKEKDIWEKLQRRKLWQRLNVAKNNTAYYMSGAWFRCYTYLLANRVLDDISEQLTGTSLSHGISTKH